MKKISRIQKKSMQKNINLQFLMVAAAAILITAIGSMLLFYTIFQNQVYDDLKDYAHMICNMEKEGLFENNSFGFKQDSLRITLIDASGTVLLDSFADEGSMGNHLSRPEIAAAMEQGEGTAIRTSDTIAIHTFYYACRLTDGKILRIGKDSENIFHILKNTLLLVAVLSILILGSCVLLSHFLTKRLLLPIERLAAHPDDISQNAVYSEMQPFIQTIKEQHVNILNHAKMRQEFTANVSHELKTPLTAISGYAELIGSGMANEKDTLHFAKEIHKSSARLLTLINDIIRLSELEENEYIFEMERTDLYLAAQGCVDMMEQQAETHDVTMHLQGESCLITTNKTLLDELLYNLCSNAIRYNKRGGSVTVTVRREGTKVLLSVKDTGIGIPKEHQERIFERFYRVDKSRSKQNGGTGLGLAIVKHVVAQHGAALELVSEEGTGTEIKIWFP